VGTVTASIALEVDVITSVLGVTADTVYDPEPPVSG
jgi:hypothetical protein